MEGLDGLEESTEIEQPGKNTTENEQPVNYGAEGSQDDVSRNQGDDNKTEDLLFGFATTTSVPSTTVKTVTDLLFSPVFFEF